MTNGNSGSSRRRVTRDVEPAALRELQERPPRASVAFVEGDAVSVLPTRARFGSDAYQFAVSAAVAPDLTHREVVLVIDDGPYWFQLRGISVRGLAEPLQTGAADGLAWYTITVRRTLAWDYGAIREA
jgi:hypothetical protein